MPGIYIHVPFCESRCAYCDFYSTTLLRHRSAYVDMVCRELQLRLPELQGAPIETIYLGGGTPSTLTIEELSSILTSIQNFQFSILNLQRPPSKPTPTTSPRSMCRACARCPS
ncbi:MAG: hypothetical protein IKJ92_03170, partial [Bacteroidaceae bacterium]|nr:hypothetical protein [Bacteroidaceae bacterium]